MSKSLGGATLPFHKNFSTIAQFCNITIFVYVQSQTLQLLSMQELPSKWTVLQISNRTRSALSPPGSQPCSHGIPACLWRKQTPDSGRELQCSSAWFQPHHSLSTSLSFTSIICFGSHKIRPRGNNLHFLILSFVFSSARKKKKGWRGEDCRVENNCIVSHRHKTAGKKWN